MPVARVLPRSWLSPARIERVIVHWTAGAYRVSDVDRQHYHAILQDNDALGRGTGVTPVRGFHIPRANDNCRDGDYAAHCSGLNTGSFGLALACMHGAAQGGPYGPYPLTRLLWERGAQAAAEVCYAYGLPVNEQTVLQHGEVQAVYGRPQRGKWDCCELPWDGDLSAHAVCDQFRRKVHWFLAGLEGRR